MHSEFSIETDFLVALVILGADLDDQLSALSPTVGLVLKTLTRDGFLRVVETGRRGSRPERTAYELTPEGEQVFFALLRDALWQVSSYALPLYAGLAFVTALRREEDYPAHPTAAPPQSPAAICAPTRSGCGAGSATSGRPGDAGLDCPVLDELVLQGRRYGMCSHPTPVSTPVNYSASSSWSALSAA